MTPKKRYDVIDYLRGFSIVVMILIHTNAYFLRDPLSSWLWDTGEFAVVAFVFCSSFLFFIKPLKDGVNPFTFLKKRLVRLLIPYYVFFITYAVILSIKTPDKISPLYLIQGFTLTGGPDINWLIILFLQMAILFPCIHWLYHKSRALFYVYGAIAFTSSFLFLFVHFPWDYRFIMWLPWSTIAVLTPLYLKYAQKTKVLVAATGVTFVLYQICYWFLVISHHPLTQYQNKYPPNIFHILYGVWFVILLMLIFNSRLFKKTPLTSVLSFFSLNSYTIYFIHYIVIYLVTSNFDHTKLKWWSFFLVVLIPTIIIQIVFNLAKKLYLRSTLKSGPTI